jgi:hypothetical protein
VSLSKWLYCNIFIRRGSEISPSLVIIVLTVWELKGRHVLKVPMLILYRSNYEWQRSGKWKPVSGISVETSLFTLSSSWMTKEYNFLFFDIQKQDLALWAYQDLNFIRQFQQIPLKLPRGTVCTPNCDFDTGSASCFCMDNHSKVILYWKL